MEEIVEEEVPEVRRPKTPPTPPEEHALSSASEEDTKKGEPVLRVRHAGSGKRRHRHD